MVSIINLDEKINNLKIEDVESYNILKGIYDFYYGIGSLKIPKSFENKILEYFGHRNQMGEITETPKQVIKRVEKQKIIKTYNKWTGQGALFNSLRTNRPGMSLQNIEKEKNELNRLVKSSKKNCDFCQPEKFTPEDVFGRVKGKHSITASNIAKYDAWSSLVIFKKHNPHDFNLFELSDYINTGFNWFRRVYQENNKYKFPFFVWNCLYKAGASQIHGHAQVLMTQEIPYAKISSIMEVSQRYRKKMHSDYLMDVFRAHQSLDLTLKMGEISILATLTPTKEREIIIISPEPIPEVYNAKKAIYNVLRCFIDILGVQSFNIAISRPSMNDEYESPYIIHIVDRGSLFRPTADIGGMELFGSTVVGEDPYIVIQTLKDYFKKNQYSTEQGLVK